MEIKKCMKCKEEKERSSYYNNRSRKDGLSDYCKTCSNVRALAYAKENKDKIREKGYRIKYLYGLSKAEYDQLLESQNGSCAICGELCPSGRKLAVDHDHETGNIRGLLCSPCNTSLGGFRDSEDLLTKAINYLKLNK